MSTPRKRPGRPALDPDDRGSVPVVVRFPPKQYDAAYQLAKHTRTSIPELIRSMIGFGQKSPKE